MNKRSLPKSQGISGMPSQDCHSHPNTCYYEIEDHSSIRVRCLTFLSKKFVSATVRFLQMDSFFTLISKWCHNVQILFTLDHYFTFDHLFYLTKLRYFNCYELKVGNVVQDPQVLFLHLKCLTNFHARPSENRILCCVLLVKRRGFYSRPPDDCWGH